jgi:hypothetical protein
LASFVPAAHTLQMLQLDWTFCISVSTVALEGGVGSTVLLAGGGPTWISLISDLSESLSESATLAHRRCWPVGMAIDWEMVFAGLLV